MPRRSRRCCCCQRIYVYNSSVGTEKVDVKGLSSILSDGSSVHPRGPSGFDHKNKNLYDVRNAGVFRTDVDLKNDANLGGFGATDFCDCLAVDYLHRRVFYPERTAGFTTTYVINTLNFDGSGYAPITTFTGSGGDSSVVVFQIAYDHSGDRLFYFRARRQTVAPDVFEIRRINADGTGDALLYTAPTVGTSNWQIGQLAVDHTNNKIWWPEFLNSNGFFALIKRMNFDGSGVESLYSASTVANPFIQAVAWSHNRKRIFWYEEDVFANGFPQAGLFSAAGDMSDQRQELSNRITDTNGGSNPFGGTALIRGIFLGCGYEETGDGTQA